MRVRPLVNMLYIPTHHPSVELAKLGAAVRGTLFIQLGSFPRHYLVLVITDEDFRYALISVSMITRGGAAFPEMIMEDIGWLDVQRVHNSGEEAKVMIKPTMEEASAGHKRKRDDDGVIAPQLQPQLRLR